MNSRTEIRAIAEDWNGKISLMMRIKQDNGNVLIAEPITFKEHKQHACINEFVSISIPQAQELIDDLWRAGLRPTEGSGSAGSLKATENHLNDMRRIVAKTLDVSL
jgi:hypothetical protein